MNSAGCEGEQPAGSPIMDAARWLATGGADKAKPLVPQLKALGLTPVQAVEAIREANLIRARSH